MPQARYGPRRRAAIGYGSSAVAALPLVTTLGATATTDTSAFLNGSVNPEGLATSFWFAWGTGAPYTSATAVTAITGTPFYPHTVGVTIEHLTPGATYHFACVGQSAGGTVYGADGTFVAELPQVVPSAATPLVPVGETIPLPHFDYPLVIRATGADVVEQGALAEVFACVRAIADCPEGACSVLPSFGRPDETFQRSPVDTTTLISAIQSQEPRASETALAQALRDDPDTGVWGILATTSSEGASSP